MIVTKYFIDRITFKEYNVGDDYPHVGASSERIAELRAGGYLVQEDAPKVEKVEKKTTTRKPRSKKG